MNVKLPTKHYLELLSLIEGCTASSDSTLVKIPIVGNHMLRLQYYDFKEGDRNIRLQDYLFESQSKKEGKDQESIQSSTTLDPGYQWESDNVKIRHYKREPRGQQIPSR